MIRDNPQWFSMRLWCNYNSIVCRLFWMCQYSKTLFQLLISKVVTCLLPLMLLIPLWTPDYYPSLNPHCTVPSRAMKNIAYVPITQKHTGYYKISNFSLHKVTTYPDCLPYQYLNLASVRSFALPLGSTQGQGDLKMMAEVQRSCFCLADIPHAV